MYSPDMSNRRSALERLLKPTSGNLSPELAKYVQSLDFSEDERERYLELSAKVQENSLTPEEEVELDELLVANDLLVILKGKAGLSLKPQNPAA